MPCPTEPCPGRLLCAPCASPFYSQVAKPRDRDSIQELFAALAEHRIAAYVYAPYLAQVREAGVATGDVGSFESHLDFRVKHFDFLVTLGGDGTILAAATLVRDTGVPIVGINLGRLGFLASIEKAMIAETVALLKRGHYDISEREMLELVSDTGLFGEVNFALNDFTLLKRDTSSMITIHAYVNGDYLNSYWADGLIVATPTGSTGYSLSCGGPIVFPGSGNFVITPVAPHNLNVRPIVISDQSVLTFEVEGRADNFLCTLDSRHELIDESQAPLAVRKCAFHTRVVRIKDRSYLHTIRGKLSWGRDARN